MVFPNVRFFARRRGVALVVVLAILILLSGLILSFFLSVTTESKGSHLADSSSRNTALIDSVTSLVMSQIRTATTRGAQVNWASQAGMIRTYGTEGGGGAISASSAPLEYYKLYSAREMTWKAGGAAFTPSADLPTTWHATPAVFTDLNEPVRNLANVLQYPVVDPTAADATSPVAGFSISDAPTDGSAAANAAPMPVRWLYVLQDGTLTSPDSGTAALAEWNDSHPNKPTRENPITGRIAFWTDDDTCKVNINTASGDAWVAENTAYGSGLKEPGSYWDVPRTGSLYDYRALADYQPALHEYQRYPGHPATTYLSAVFPWVTREQLNVVSARITMGGSRGGTALATTPIVTDTDRLYASVDELGFLPDRGVQNGISKAELDRRRFFVTASSRAPEVNLFNQPRVSIWPVHEVNDDAHRTAYDRLTAFCAQINTASGRKSFFFTRANADSATEDIMGFSSGAERNRELYGYLRRLTGAPIPGFGGDFLSKYPSSEPGKPSDRDQILTQILDYIRCTNLFDDLLPGSYAATSGQFTRTRTNATGTRAGHGQVAPLKIGNARGFGRVYSLSEAGFHFIATADHAYPDSNHENNRTLKEVAGQPAVLLLPGQRRIEAAFLMELFSPALGFTILHPSMQIRVQGLQHVHLNGEPLGFPADATLILQQTSGGATYDGRSWGGTGGFRLPLAVNRNIDYPSGHVNNNCRRAPARGGMPADAGYSATNGYPFISKPVTVNAAGPMIFSGPGGSELPEIVITIYNRHDLPQHDDRRLQTVRLKFPNGSFPVPRLVRTDIPSVVQPNGTVAMPMPKEHWWTFSNDGILGQGGRPSANIEPGRAGRLTGVGQRLQEVVGGVRQVRSGGFITQDDVVRTILPRHGDYRLSSVWYEVPADVFQADKNVWSSSAHLHHWLSESVGPHVILNAANNPNQVFGAYAEDIGSNGGSTGPYSDSAVPDITPEGTTLAAATGDWDNAVAHYPDGAYINKPDEGNNLRTGGGVPYYDNSQSYSMDGPTFFSPNRQVSSPVMVGSLPSQAVSGVPWQTLLFRPDSSASHKGAQAGQPHDHLFLDLFWMPVVEPYAISEPLSTAGKINMNHEIMPFRHLRRSTALRALLRSERVIAIRNDQGEDYKRGVNLTTGVELTNVPYRFDINADETLKQFQQRFDANDIFRSASEICDLHLVPQGWTLPDMSDFWQNHALTGDNSRERPYSGLYPRLTTKSNTYTIHYKVQSLQQASRSRGDDAGAWATWDESKDVVRSESRGSTTIERYIDPSTQKFVDFATTPEASLDAQYRFRVISTKRFLP